MEVLRNLPPYVSSMVVEYLAPLGKIYFRTSWQHYGSSELATCNYSPKYELAYQEDRALSRLLYTSSDRTDTQTLHLSKISKKNGRHRYYLTFVDEHEECMECGRSRTQCSKRFCDGCQTNELYFSSTYIGTNLEVAIVTFLQYRTGVKT
jgi:hypothetical protein|tara:strand:+ start:262 stop:711 length:450 start_codon:yes stop_codon:yes gene_type:complete